MDAELIIILLLLFVTFCITLFFHFTEKKRLKSYIKNKYHPDLTKEISFFFTYQTIYLLFIIIISIMVITFYSWRLTDTNNKLLQLQNNALITKTIETEQLENKNTTALAPAPENTTNTTVAISKNSAQSTIEEVFNSDQKPDINSAIDNIKRRYEELLVNYFFLQKCGKTTEKDYQIIFQSLQKEAIPLHAPERLQYDVLTAAKGSYDELYSKNECIAPNVESSYKQFNDYIILLENRINNPN